ncbi:chromosome segregation protein SMC [Beggiatoa leptomitoformis]|uniref:Chromosome partition protein Smc n=1 Tax=Beggiatoa leptomitoformis TaxID=288004 RepID=A0A2N9YCS6_9GAMM|nr:chromosome segregation protein SMC [Beggiatoa leptomitoformis]ALG66460.1 chromosome segregation protein SMC [Beggiatoa leptomitoformis]AUI68257.1 chromosome segregation protein SMC [Beggiatoa leptomitoformis]
MRLSKIKLAGFKSFVDPTTIPFPSNRVCVVGPNGCGKSNVIDAVRWVMGESSAKNLRGGAMTDVIFNGSGGRKPVEQATVELWFEEVTIPPYQENGELAIKRLLTRDGDSQYFINNERCRRKDITDLFLGTGLGPRSYAIVEQGMISRFIEAKPDELRVFLEEAAGISKYKERRKETEQRMAQTRDNLDRLNDLREELSKQIDKLKRQAREAERFQELKQSETLLKAQLDAIRWHELNMAVQDMQQQIDEKAIVLQEDLLTLQALQETHQAQRVARLDAQTHLETIQAQFYTIDSEVKRLEQTLEHGKERYEQLQWDLEQLDDSVNETQNQWQTDKDQAETLSSDIAETEAYLEELQETEIQTESALQDAEADAQTWQTTWEEFTQRANEPTQRAQIERTRLHSMEQRVEHNRQRLDRLDTEHQQIDVQSLELALQALETEMADVQTEWQEAEALLAAHQETVLQLREETQQLSAELHEKSALVHQLSGRLASLEALQEAALGKNNADLDAWLHVQGLDNVPHLSQALNVDAGWEQAVEMVLDKQLNALCINKLDEHATALQKPPQGQFMLVTADKFTANVNDSHPTWTPLLDKITTTLSLDSFLSSIWAANDLNTALAMRPHLSANESIITPQSVWLGTNWLHCRQGKDEKTGMIGREQEINRIASQLEALDQAVLVLNQTVEQKRIHLREMEGQRDHIQQRVNQVRQRFSELQSQQGGKQARLEAVCTQLQRVEREKSELTNQINQDESDIAETRHNLHIALAEMEQLADERDRLSTQKAHAQEVTLQSRQAWQTAREARHQVEMTLGTQRTNFARLQQAIERLQERLNQLQEQRHDLQKNLEKQIDPTETLHGELAAYQEKQAESAETLRQAKQTVEHLEHAMTDYEEQRRVLETRSSELRTILEQLRIDSQAKAVRKQTLDEKFALSDFSPIALVGELPEYADETSWVAQIEAVERKLERIGAVNMAALAEYEQEAQRKQYMDEQWTDLTSALEQLDNAIRTIDRETRSRFKQTVESVNATLQVTFPKLFGGGEARLELTSDDLLKAGVAIMARPPGKRNSTIHLLSGGEKALTALSMVFAIFELNPAPFCMLDEVDAPLDDTNVGRYSELIKAMSERVQIIFISHNKIAMEVANQLMGVTMQEAGVSRLVSVDINEAVDMVGV